MGTKGRVTRVTKIIEERGEKMNGIERKKKESFVIEHEYLVAKTLNAQERLDDALVELRGFLTALK